MAAGLNLGITTVRAVMGERMAAGLNLGIKTDRAVMGERIETHAS